MNRSVRTSQSTHQARHNAVPKPSFITDHYRIAQYVNLNHGSSSYSSHPLHKNVNVISRHTEKRGCEGYLYKIAPLSNSYVFLVIKVYLLARISTKRSINPRYFCKAYKLKGTCILEVRRAQ
jgi:hypothetical protein